jgi:aryl-alcohol dehydrogenase-like predicted oxidoreductase
MRPSVADCAVTRAKVVLATKVGFRSGSALTQSGLSRRHIRWSVEQSLRRLGTDWIDVYIAHREDPHTPLEETLAALDVLVQAGKVRCLGFSNWSAWKVAAAIEIQCAAGPAAFTHGQMHYSLLGRDVEPDVIPMMRRYGLGLTVWSPLASGFLSGKYTRETLSAPDNRYSGFDILPFDKQRTAGPNRCASRRARRRHRAGRCVSELVHRQVRGPANAQRPCGPPLRGSCACHSPRACSGARAGRHSR